MYSAPNIPGGITYSSAVFYPCIRLTTVGYTAIAMNSNPNGYWYPIGTQGASHLSSIMAVNGGLVTVSGNVWSPNNNPNIWMAI